MNLIYKYLLSGVGVSVAIVAIASVPLITFAESCTGDPWICFQPLAVSCSVNPSSGIAVGDRATLSALASGLAGTAPYVYTWVSVSGGTAISPSPSAALPAGQSYTMSHVFTSPGLITRIVEVSGQDYLGFITRGSCTINVNVARAPIGASCTLDSQCQSGNCKNGNICAAPATASISAKKPGSGNPYVFGPGPLTIDYDADNAQARLAWDMQNVDSGSCDITKAGASWKTSVADKNTGVDSDLLDKDTTFVITCTWGSAQTPISRTMNILVDNRAVGLSCTGTRTTECNNLLYCALSGGTGICTPKPPPPKFSFLGSSGSTIDVATFTIPSGGDVTLRWFDLTDVSSCTASGAWTGGQAIGGGTQTFNSITSQKTYTLTCTGPAGASTVHSVTVNVVVVPPPNCDSYVSGGWGPCSSVSFTETEKISSYLPAGCVNPTNIRPATRSCTIQCTGYTYSAYGICDPGTSTQTRRVTGRIPSSGCNAAPVEPPVDLSKDCTPQCTNISYSEWGACTDGTQTRTETSRTPAGCLGIAETEQSCEGGYPPPSGTPGKITDPLGGLTISQFISKALKAFVDLLVPIIVIFYLITGLMFITARGNPEKLKVARTALLYVTIGAAVVLGAWVLAETIDATIKAVSRT